MLDWLGEDHVVWFIIRAIKRMDTTRFHARARLGGVGRRGYDPDMVLTLFAYAMASKVSSSRQIERLCHTDVAFRIICAQDVPDHTVLSRFRQQHQEALKDLLKQSLELADEVGMVNFGVVAFDGTKIAANASKEANHKEEYFLKLAEQYVDQVEHDDQVEDDLYGVQARGDELPPALRDRSGQKERIDAALKQIGEQKQKKEREQHEQQHRAQQCEQAVADGRRRGGRYPKGTDRVVVAKARWLQEHQAASARYEAWLEAKQRGQAPKGRPVPPPDEYFKVRRAWATYQQALAHDQSGGEQDQATGSGVDGKSKEPIANLTDPDSRLLKTRNGWVQGYNVQTAVSSDGFIVAARATQDANDVQQFEATMNDVTAMAAYLAQKSGCSERGLVGVMIGDAGYDSDANLLVEGPDRLIADGKRRGMEDRVRTSPLSGDPPVGADAREVMNHRLRTEEGMALYRRRSHMVEAPNAWLKDGRGLRQFARRGVDAVQSELSLGCAVTNLLRMVAKGVTVGQLVGLMA